jgi:Ice-binding-like/Bacterial Ig-like domain
MRILHVGKTWIPAFLLTFAMSGCGREQTVLMVPTVTSTNPANLATGVPVTQLVTANFSVAMNPTTINSMTFTLAGPGGAAIMGTVTYAGTTATFIPAANLLPSTVYTGTITIGATDVTGGSLAANVVWTFTTGTIPQVTSTIPANGATGVPLNQKISATFSESMNSTTITMATFTVTGPGTTAVAGVVTYVAASNTAIFTPTANLTASTVYIATITNVAKSALGSPLAANYVWKFTTGTTAQGSLPTIISTIAVNGATAVPINQKVSAIFSTAMNAATINSTTFTLTGPGATAVAGSVTYAAGSNTAVFMPTANLAPSTTYTATVTTGAQDLAGNALGAGAVPNPWTFTTGTAASTTAPTITLTNPANVATNVQLNTTVNATFSEAMDPTTLTTATFTLTAPPGATLVTGTVSYAPATDIATFTPTSQLAPNTEYTATVTTGAKDTFGNALAAGPVPNPWTFTTGTAAGLQSINLGSLSTFGAFGGTAGMTNQGINTEINNGNIATTAVSTAVTGFHDTTLPGSPPPCSYTETPLNIGVVDGEIYTAAPPPTVMCPNEGTAATFAIATQAAADALSAYNAMVALPPGANPGANLGGLTLAPGVYTAPGGSFLLTGSDLTLDAQGNANAVWVFQMATSLTVGAAGAPRSVTLINGAQAQNVFWQVGSAATINGAGGGTMVGTIIAMSGITFSTAGNNAPPFTVLDGRAAVLVGPVTMVNTIINVP